MIPTKYKNHKLPIYVIINCYRCNKEVAKKRSYYIRRVREKGEGVKIFCDRECVNEHHSNSMKGEDNPNYEGKWHSQCPSLWSKDKRKRATEKMVETVIREGTFRGSNNGRWAGGEKEHKCVICDKISKFSPYVHRLIEAGKRQPCCSNTCAAALGRRNIKYEATSIEVAMAVELERRGIEYIDQYNLGDKFSLDFYIPKYNVVIECDGDYWHNIPEVVIRDRSKNAYIKACGHSLYRFWEHEINENVAACVDMIMVEINECDTAI